MKKPIRDFLFGPKKTWGGFFLKYAAWALVAAGVGATLFFGWPAFAAAVGVTAAAVGIGATGLALAGLCTGAFAIGGLIIAKLGNLIGDAGGWFKDSASRIIPNLHYGKNDKDDLGMEDYNDDDALAALNKAEKKPDDGGFDDGAPEFHGHAGAPEDAHPTHGGMYDEDAGGGGASYDDEDEEEAGHGGPRKGYSDPYDSDE